MTPRLVAAACLATGVLLAGCSSSTPTARKFFVPSAAMAPTIQENASIRVYVGNYDPQRGDVITIRAPADGAAPGIALPNGGTLSVPQPAARILVKRVIGLPGET